MPDARPLSDRRLSVGDKVRFRHRGHAPDRDKRVFVIRHFIGDGRRRMVALRLEGATATALLIRTMYLERVPQGGKT